MDDIATLDAYRSPAARHRPRMFVRAQATFYFDLYSPDTYLEAERADRCFARLRWQPASLGASPASGSRLDDAARAAVTLRAQRLGMPFVWPESAQRAYAPACMRVASLAAERGRGAEFAMAAGRLIFCGGYDIEEDRAILAVAAEVAGIGPSELRSAAADESRDAVIEQAGRSLLAMGATRLPALMVDGAIFCGENPVDDMAARLAATAHAARSQGDETAAATAVARLARAWSKLPTAHLEEPSTRRTSGSGT